MLYLYGELKTARKLAAAIVRARANRRIETTGQLLEVVAPAMGQHPSPTPHQPSPNAKKDLARLFQALRIEVNHEMEALKEMLLGATELLGQGGRLSVITYHSLEDRIVKNVMKAGNVEGRVSQDFYGRVQTPFRQVGKLIVPTAEEQERNPRSRSAKLRIAEKTDE